MRDYTVLKVETMYNNKEIECVVFEQDEFRMHKTLYVCYFWDCHNVFCEEAHPRVVRIHFRYREGRKKGDLFLRMNGDVSVRVTSHLLKWIRSFDFCIFSDLMVFDIVERKFYEMRYKKDHVELKGKKEVIIPSNSNDERLHCA